jgi:hypothetical protein
LIAFELTRLEFGIAVRDTASKVLAQHGEAGYKSRWVQHDFPTSSLTLLNDYISGENVTANTTLDTEMRMQAFRCSAFNQSLALRFQCDVRSSDQLSVRRLTENDLR